jgi:hypothetical protein
MRFLFFLYVASARFVSSCTGNKCELTDQSVSTCALTCNNTNDECYCGEDNSTALACYLSDKVIDDLCVDRTDKHFLYRGRCLYTTDKLYCAGYTVHEYLNCPWIMRSICNFFRGICRLFGGNVANLNMRYYTYKDIYGKEVKVNHLLRSGLVDCSSYSECYHNPLTEKTVYDYESEDEL